MAEKFIADNLQEICIDDAAASPMFRGGQSHAESKLKEIQVDGYSKGRNHVYPADRRVNSGLSAYMNTGLLSITDVWHSIKGPKVDVDQFHEELLWQEYARHWYAVLGETSLKGTQREIRTEKRKENLNSALDQQMGCVELTTSELEEDGWLTNESRQWLVSLWCSTAQKSWQSGAEYFYQHLLDGSAAANRLGWQLSAGVSSSEPYKLTRWEVEERAAGLCASCELAAKCPIETAAESPVYIDTEFSYIDSLDAVDYFGPQKADSKDQPELIWLNTDSMGNSDPTLEKFPELPIAFIFDKPDLMKLKLSSKRLIFWTEIISELATQRKIEIYFGNPIEILKGKKLATTYIPKPRFREISDQLNVVFLAPWKWLLEPKTTKVESFKSWVDIYGPELAKLNFSGFNKKVGLESVRLCE